jgi:hypothetical protein
MSAFQSDSAVEAIMKRPGQATHYTIFPAVDMPLDNFKLLLRQIAESVKVNPMFKNQN